MFIAVDKLKPLHKILFGTVGKAATLKQDIENFKGYVFDDKKVTEKRFKMIRISADGARKKVTIGSKLKVPPF